MKTFIRRFFAVILALSMMIPAVAISEETPALTVTLNKMTFNAGESIVITYEGDPAQINTDTYGFYFYLTNTSYEQLYTEYCEKWRNKGTYSGTYSLQIPEWMDGTYDVIVTCRGTEANPRGGYVTIKGITVNGPEERPVLNDIQFSKPLENVKVGDSVEITVAEGTAPMGLEFWYHTTEIHKGDSYKTFNYEYWQDAELRKYTYTFDEEAQYRLVHDQQFGIEPEGYVDGVTLSVRQIDIVDLRKIQTTPKPTTKPTVAPTTQPTVKPTIKPGTPSEPVELNLDAITIGAKQSVSTVKVESGKNITWTSANEKIATVDANGKITGVKKGKTTITATDEYGQSDSVEVTVVAKNKGVKKIKLNKKSATLKQGEKLTLAATLTPTGAKNKNIIWKSSDTSVVTVDSKGKVKAVGTGKATITAISSSGKTAKCEITVTGAKVKKITLSGEKTMKKGETQQLTAKIKPVFAENQNLKWKSSNKKVATVDANGVVTALKKGTVTITATAKDGSKVKATFTIKIKK